MDVLKNNNFQTGFTLIEVIVSIIILSGSLIVLLGLQSAAVSKALRDRTQLQAMMAARHILAAIETQGESEPRTQTETVYRMLEDLNALPYADEELQELYNNMNVDLEIAEWPNPPELAAFSELNQNLMSRVLLRVFWGEFPDDQLEIVYFIPNQIKAPQR